jgi:CRP/FNR family cyclic AMP-dependent transcriptional regulator
MVSITLRDSRLQNVEEFLAAAHRRKYPRGTTIIYAGEQSDSIYYITRGSMTVLIEDDLGREIIVAYLNEGDFFGEMELFGEGTRTAWLKAKTECEVAELSYPKFEELSEGNAGVLYELASQLVERLDKTNAEGRRPSLSGRDRPRRPNVARPMPRTRGHDPS